MSNKPIHSHDSHGFGPARDGHAHSDIARDGAPKHVHSVKVHDGMTRRQTNAANIGGMGHPVAGVGEGGGQPIATNAAASPLLVNAYGSKPKRLAPVTPSFGMKHRDTGKVPNLEELGRAVLAEAVKN